MGFVGVWSLGGESTKTSWSLSTDTSSSNRGAIAIKIRSMSSSSKSLVRHAMDICKEVLDYVVDGFTSLLRHWTSSKSASWVNMHMTSRFGSGAHSHQQTHLVGFENTTT
ncbi:putative pectinesterase/pectinesterase inhibitor-like [Sesbania bispinosa]|nr:putative pectinesterase/pectinesterase inhibitor-like [Sesbania bispinosa]